MLVPVDRQVKDSTLEAYTSGKSILPGNQAPYVQIKGQLQKFQ